MIQITPMNEQNYKAVAAIEAACFSHPWSEKTFFEELSNEQAARVMKKNSRQMKNLVYRAKSALKSEMEKEGFVYEELF